MNRVYRRRSETQDDYLGYVSEEGKVYENRLDAEKYIGRVQLESGKIYAFREGKDRHIGHVELDSGKIYLARLGPDENVGVVHGNGKLYFHRFLASDHYLGRVEEMTSLAHGGAAFLLLVQPAYQNAKAHKKESQSDLDLGDETGPATAPAD